MLDLFTQLGQALDQELSKIPNVSRNNKPRNAKGDLLPLSKERDHIVKSKDRFYTVSNPRIITPKKVINHNVIADNVTVNVNGNIVSLDRSQVTDKIYSLIRSNKGSHTFYGQFADLIDAVSYVTVISKTVEKTATSPERRNRNKSDWEENVQGKEENQRACQYRKSQDVKQPFQLLTIDTVKSIRVNNHILLSDIKPSTAKQAIQSFNRRNITIDTIGDYSTIYYEKVTRDNHLYSVTDDNGYVKLRLKLTHDGKVLGSVDKTCYHDVLLGQYVTIKITASSSGLTVLDDYITYQSIDNVLFSSIDRDRLQSNLVKIIPSVLPLLPCQKELTAKRNKDLKICKNTLRHILESLGFDPVKYNKRLINTNNFPDSLLITLLLEQYDIKSLVWLKKWLLDVKHNPNGYLSDLNCLTRYIA